VYCTSTHTADYREHLETQVEGGQPDPCANGGEGIDICAHIIGFATMFHGMRYRFAVHNDDTTKSNGGSLTP